MAEGRRLGFRIPFTSTHTPSTSTFFDDWEVRLFNDPDLAPAVEAWDLGSKNDAWWGNWAPRKRTQICPPAYGLAQNLDVTDGRPRSSLGANRCRSTSARNKRRGVRRHPSHVSLTLNRHNTFRHRRFAITSCLAFGKKMRFATCTR